MTNHFNKLTEAEQERLAILIEECGEVIQCGCKVLRHGYNSDFKGVLAETNREALQRELGDLINVLNRMQEHGDLNKETIKKFAAIKRKRIHPFVHHQQ